ncbi:MAG TPA: hypothetical protein VJS63_08290 [Bradyrhizobium sp.]|nr:hypothetical protein [Bradyrhizobium sp.]
MDTLIVVVILIGKILIAAIALIGVALVARFAHAVYVRASVKHAPIEYYRGWDGYSHPIRLDHKINREEADALHAQGRVYLIGYYNEGRLTRVTKILKGAVFFDFEYAYHRTGKCKTIKTTNARGVVKVREYDRRGRGHPENPSGFW